MTHSITNDSERHVSLIISIFGVEVVSFCFSNIPLSVGTIWVLAASHTDCTIYMGKIVMVFHDKCMPISTTSTFSTCGRIYYCCFASWISCLSDEIIDYTMKENPIINPTFNMHYHVCSSIWCPFFE